MDDSDILYDDLFENLENGQTVIKTSFHELEERIQQLNGENEHLKLQLSDLQSQNEKITKQNEVLIRNISCLFKTAQVEIARKDKQIRSLQEEAFKASTMMASPSTETSNGREIHAVDQGKYMGKCNRIGDVSEGISCHRKRMACDVPHAGENYNVSRKRLEAVNQETIDIRRPSERNDEGSNRFNQAGRRLGGYLEKEGRSSRDRKNDVDDRNHSCHAAVNGGYDEVSWKIRSENITKKTDEENWAEKCSKNSMPAGSYVCDKDLYSGEKNTTASEKYKKGGSESCTKQVDGKRWAERDRVRWSKSSYSARDGNHGNAGNEIRGGK